MVFIQCLNVSIDGVDSVHKEKIEVIIPLKFG